MSLLERLKREAEQQKAAQEAEARVREERDRIYLGEIDPRMKSLVEYLEGLLHTLQQLKPQVYVKLPIQGYGDLAALPLFDFKFNADRRYRSWLLELDWTLRVDPERTPVVSANTATRVRALSDAFRALHLGGVKELRRNNSQEIVEASFHARGHIKANMKATISQDDPVLRLSFTNVSWLGTSRRQMPWQQIDELLFDRLGRYLAREDDSLFTEELPEELKQRLRTEGSTIPASALTAPNPAPPPQTTPPPARTQPAPPSVPQAASIPVTAPAPVAAPARPAPSVVSAANAAAVSAPASQAPGAVWSGDLAAPPPLSADGAKLLNSDEEEAMMRALAALDPSLVEGDAKPVPATPPAAVAAPVAPVPATPAPARPAAAPAPAVANPPQASAPIPAPTRAPAPAPAPMVPPAAATRAVPAPAVPQAAAPSNSIAPTPSPPPVAAPPQTAVPAAPAREVAVSAATAAPAPVPAAPATSQPAAAPTSAAELLAQAASSGSGTGTGTPLQGNARMASFLSRMSKTLTQLRDEEEKKKG